MNPPSFYEQEVVKAFHELTHNHIGQVHRGIGRLRKEAP